MMTSMLRFIAGIMDVLTTAITFSDLRTTKSTPRTSGKFYSGTEKLNFKVPTDH